MLKPQWYVNCQQMAKDAIEAVRNEDLRIFPKLSEREWFSWLENIQDWCISRQLWWGHTIPAYFIQINGKTSDVRFGQPVDMIRTHTLSVSLSLTHTHTHTHYTLRTHCVATRQAVLGVRSHVRGSAAESVRSLPIRAPTRHHTGTGPRRARHVVLIGTLALRHLWLAGEGSSPVQSMVAG